MLLKLRNPFRRGPKRPLRKREILARVLVFGVAAVALVILGIAYRLRQNNIRVWATDLHVWPAPRREDRILIFAPHCDDETLGLSGYMQKAVSAGATVRVVFVTNGDGFRWSAERQLRRFRISPQGFVQFGMERQKEALNALSVSGIPAHDVVFLGYPDRGVASLWLHNWTPSNPYQSGFTGHRRSPYPNSLTPHAPYCGQSLLADVDRVIRDFRPTIVFSPHPNENHPDHWGTYSFVTEALWDERDRLSPRPVEALYLIHRGDWPVPQGYHPQDDLPPPSGLLSLDTQWRQIPLTPTEVARKTEALKKYVSQTRVMNRFLVSFVRRNELAGVRPYGRLAIVPDGTIRADGNDAEWKDIPVGVHDPVGDSVQAEVGGSGDVVSLSAAEDSQRLYVRIQLRKGISPRVAYELYWHPLPDTPSGTRGISLRLGKPLPPRISAVPKGNVWEVSLPKPPGRAVFMGVSCRYRRFPLDKSGWRILTPEPVEP